MTTRISPAIQPNGTGLSSAASSASPWKAVLIAAGLTIALLFLFGLKNNTDYVGIDNDDGMRLVEVRDLVNGQSWFDTTQYRLGPPGGTEMHWSRFVDLPIATMIRGFSLVTDAATAERIAVTIWPLILVVPMLYGIGRSGQNLGGRPALQIALVLGSIMLIAGVKFRPGAIDHHNVQMSLIALTVAGLLDRGRHPLSFALSGLCTALAICIGVETIPLVAASCTVVALMWCVLGAEVRGATLAFTLTLAGILAASFLATIPPAHYLRVTCDNISLGFLAPALTGALSLAAVAATLGKTPLPARLAGLALVGAAVVVVTLRVAPQCLADPFATMDPLLIELWLSGIQEAQPVTAVFAREPAELATYYVPGTLALLVCLWRIAQNDRRAQHLVLLPLILTAYGVTLFQVRGVLFLDLLAVITLSAAIADLRARATAEPKNIGRGLAFAGLTLASISPVWSILALAIPSEARDRKLAEISGETVGHREACGSPANLAALANEAPTAVLAPSDLGVALLRFTPHRVLTAPYHRNQAGMLAELKIGMAPPAEAEAQMRALGVTIVTFCAQDPQTRILATRAPDGLYARLDRNEIPAFLEPIPQPEGAPLRLFRLRPA